MSDRRRGWGLRTRIWLLLIALFAILFATMAVAITPENYNIQAGDVATENILAVREVVDEEATAEQKQQARDAVGPVYVADSALTANIQGDFDDFFQTVDTTRSMAAQVLQDYLDDYMANGQAGEAPTYQSSLTGAQWQTLLSFWPTQTDKSELAAWLMMDEDAYQSAVSQTRTIVSNVLDNGVREAMMDEETMDLQETIDALDAPDEIKALMKLAVSENLQPNAFYDSSATEQARQDAEDAVTNVTYKKGQVIVRLGEVITDRHIEMLSSMGMLVGGIVWPVYIGALLSALIAVGAIALFLRMEKTIARDFKKALMVCLVMYAVVLINAFLQYVDLQLVPVIFVAITLSLTTNRACGAVMGMITTFVCAATALAAGLEGFVVLSFLIAGWISSYLAAYAVKRYPSRSGIVGIGIAAGAAGAFILMVLALLTHMDTQQMVVAMGMQLLGGVLSSVLCLGTMPIWESVFKALTPMKLMELCNPTNPLLKRLMYETPGTYHHSVMVGNLAEAAADAIGANALLARVGAYYHDVGKLVAPLYFNENQPEGMRNPHDMMEPLDSARLIQRHPHDGAALLKEQGFAQPIIDMALQHHGSTPYIISTTRRWNRTRIRISAITAIPADVPKRWKQPS